MFALPAATISQKYLQRTCGTTPVSISVSVRTQPRCNSHSLNGTNLRLVSYFPVTACSVSKNALCFTFYISHRPHFYSFDRSESGSPRKERKSTLRGWRRIRALAHELLTTVRTVSLCPCVHITLSDCSKATHRACNACVTSRASIGHHMKNVQRSNVVFAYLRRA